MSIFLDLFSYALKVPPLHGNSNSVFHDCVILKAFGKYTPGQRVPYISVQVTMFLWENDQNFEEETVYV